MEGFRVEGLGFMGQGWSYIGIKEKKMELPYSI